MSILAFTGFKRSGKSTAAGTVGEIMQDFSLFGEVPFRWRSFASPLKKHCADLFGLSHAQLYGDQKEIVDPRYDKTPREILQEVGTFYRETYGNRFWIDCLDRERYDSEITIIDDCRYPNEADYVRSRGGIVIGITRPDAGLDDDHISETAMAENWDDMIDYEIMNDGKSKRDLVESIEGILRDEGYL